MLQTPIQGGLNSFVSLCHCATQKRWQHEADRDYLPEVPCIESLNLNQVSFRHYRAEDSRVLSTSDTLCLEKAAKIPTKSLIFFRTSYSKATYLRIYGDP
jgi:hypothetical protein